LRIADLEMAITMAPRFFLNDKSKVLKIGGILPSRAACSEAAQKYLAFMKSPHGRELIEKGLAMDWLRHGF